MVISQELNDALNQQVLHELRNKNIYTQISCFFDGSYLRNLADYFKKAAEHEDSHATKFVSHINSRKGGKVDIKEINSPNISLVDFVGVGDIFIKTEEATTKSISDIYQLAVNEKSYIDAFFLLGMLNEQVEEEDSANDFATKIKMALDMVLFDATFEVGD